MGQESWTLSVVPSTRQTRIMVADPYPVIVHGVRTMVEDDPRFQVVAEASTMRSFRKKLIAERPEVALLDWSMASQDLKAITELLQSDQCTTSIIFLTVSENSPQKQEMLRLGARAFLSKWCSARKLRTTVWRACHGGMSLEVPAPAASTGGSFLVANNTDPVRCIRQLTRRERQLLPLVCCGLKNKDIALRLGIAESTVWHHLTSVFTKLKVGDRLGLAAFAYGHGLARPAPQLQPAISLSVLGSQPRTTPL